MVLPSLAALLVLAAQGTDAAEPIVSALRASIREGRARAGVPAAAEPAAAMRVARQRAQQAARLPSRRRLAAEGSTLEALARAGMKRLDEVEEYVQEQDGYADPASAAVEGFRDHPLWRRALDPEVTAFAAGAAQAPDGTLLIVVLLLEEREVRDLRDMESEAERAVNRVRAQHGLPPLVPLEALIDTARAHSQDMARRGYFEHEDPKGRKAADRVTAAGVRWLRVTENLAMNAGMDDPVEQALEGWMDSRGHRANILDPAVTHTGVGIAEDAKGAYLFTQLFVALRPAR